MQATHLVDAAVQTDLQQERNQCTVRVGAGTVQEMM
jgi:hypothetical protein